MKTNDHIVFIVDDDEEIDHSEARPAANDIEHGLELAMVMSRGARSRLDHDCACPEPVRSRTGMSDCGSPRHAGCLRSIAIELSRANDANSVLFPVRHPITILRSKSGWHYANVGSVIMSL